MKDNCVSCNEETIYNRTDHIHFRVGYIEGAGQLCLDCYDEIYIGVKNVDKPNAKGNQKNKK